MNGQTGGAGGDAAASSATDASLLDRFLDDPDADWAAFDALCTPDPARDLDPQVGSPDPQVGSPAARERGLDPPGPGAASAVPASPDIDELAVSPPAAAVATPPPSLLSADAELACDAPPARDNPQLLLSDSPHYRHYNAGPCPVTPVNYTTTVYSPEELPRLLDHSTPILPSENRPRGGDELADGPPPADPRLGVVEPDGEVVLDLLHELDRARARVAELEQLCDPQALVEQDQLAWAAAVALTDCDYEEQRERSAEQERAVEARRALEMERTMRRLQAMTQSARTGKTVTLYFGDGRAPLPVQGPRWLAEQPPYGSAEAEQWESKRNALIARTAKDVRREMEAEEEHEAAEDGAWQDSDLDSDSGKEHEDQQGGGSDRDTHFDPDSSPELPADLGADADRAVQAVFEEAVADGSYFAGFVPGRPVVG